MAKVKKQKQKRYSARERAAYWFGVGTVAESDGMASRIYKHGDAKVVRSFNEGRQRETHNGVSNTLLKPRIKRRR